MVDEPELTALLLATDGMVPVGVRREGATVRANDKFLDFVLGELAGSDPAACRDCCSRTGSAG